jgi:hypothetical protein
MIDKLCQYWLQAKQSKTHHISINDADTYSPFHPHTFASINTPSQPDFLRSYYSNDVGWNKISNVHKTYHCGTFPWSLCIEDTTFHCVCVVVTELHVTVNYIKIPSFAQKCCNGKLLSQATMQNYTYQFLKEIIFQLIYTWPSLDTQFEWANHNGSHCIVSLFL